MGRFHNGFVWGVVLLSGVVFVGAITKVTVDRYKAAALATQPSTTAERGIEMKAGYRVDLHRLPNGVPCAVLTGGPDQSAITCGWDAKPVKKP